MQVSIMTFGPSIPADTTKSDMESDRGVSSAVKAVVDRFLEQHPDAWNFNINIKIDRPKAEAGAQKAGAASAA